MDCWTGKVKGGDQVLIGRLLEPTRPGSSIYQTTERETHIFVEDVRLKVALGHVESRSSKRNTTSNQATKRFVLDQKDKLKVDELCAA